MNTNTKDILEALSFLRSKVEQLPTQDDMRLLMREEIRATVPGILQELVPPIVALELRPIRAELMQIRKDITRLQDDVGAHAGYAKEIDHLLDRVVAIERHLGIENKIAA